MPPGQDDNPFGTPRGAWGRQPPTTFGLPVKRPARPIRPANQIRVPAPTVAPRNILSGGLAPQPRAAPPVQAMTPEPEPALLTPAAPLIAAAEVASAETAIESVLVRASARPKRRLPIPQVAGVGVLIAIAVVGGMALLRRPPPPSAAGMTAPVAPSPALAAQSQAPDPAPETPAVIAAAPPPAAPRLTAATRAVSRPDPAPPITPPPLATPEITAAPPAPAPILAIPPPADPEAPMTTRLPDAQ